MIDAGVDGGTDAGVIDSGTPVAPKVVSTTPWDNATSVALNVKVVTTFSAPMDPATLTALTFNVKRGASTVAGAVATSGSTATFVPSSNLVPSTDYTATISTGAKDLGGRALAAPYAWSFTTGTATAQGPAPVGLGAAGNYVVLAKTAISTVPGSTLTGSLGLSPAAASYITGFSLVADSTNVFSNSTQVVGKVYAANYAVPTPSNLTTAVSNMEAAYTDAAGRPTPDFLELS
ncbi:MAG: Ig-like domain-containing protein, partial [Myxococcaceae bacterium]